MVMDRGGEASLLTPPQRSERRYGVLGPQSTMRDRDGVGFASHENLAEVVPYLNRSLNDLGYPSPLELEAPSAGDLARVANVLFLVLRDRTQDISSREQWGRERRRLTADKTRAETFYERARAELAAKDEELANSLAKSDGRVDKERKRLDETTAEVTALKQRLLKSTQRCATLENESRRREKEREKLSARLEKFVNDRRRDVANAAPVGVMRLGRPDDTREPGHVVEEKVAYGGLNAANVSAHVSVHATGRHKDLTAATATSKAAALDAAARVAAAAASPFVSQELHHQMMGAYEAKMRSLMHDANDLRELLTANGVDPETGERIGGLGAGTDFADQGVVRMEEPEPRSHPMALGDVEDETAAAARDAARAAAATEAEIGVGDDAFSFNLGALRDRLGSPSRKPTRVEATERLPTAPPAALDAPNGGVSVTGRTRGMDGGDVMDVDEGNEGAFGSPSPIEVALAWHEREHARLKSVLTHPPKALREASTPDVQFEVEKTILSPVKSVASVGGSLAAAREGLHAAVAAAARASPARRSSPGGAHRSQKPQTTASASASPARQQLHWNEPPFTAVSAPIYESSPSVSSAGDGPEEPPPPTPRMAPPPMFDNPMLSVDDALDDEELAREAAAAGSGHPRTPRRRSVAARGMRRARDGSRGGSTRTWRTRRLFRRRRRRLPISARVFERCHRLGPRMGNQSARHPRVPPRSPHRRHRWMSCSRGTLTAGGVALGERGRRAERGPRLAGRRRIGGPGTGGVGPIRSRLSRRTTRSWRWTRRSRRRGSRCFTADESGSLDDR